MSNTKPPRLTAKKIYLKDASLESPASPGVFLNPELKPKIDININVNNTRLDEEGKFYEVILQVTATASQEENTLFVAEVKDAGIFEINVDNDEQKELILNVGCPNMLLPFSREEIANLVAKAGFPQLLISPMNFERIYRQRLAKEKDTETPETRPEQTH